MKFAEYPNIKNLLADNVIMLDGPEGSKHIEASELIYALLHLTGVSGHRSVFRGKNLGTAISEEQLAAIRDGSFTDLWLGDYWTIGGHTWRIVDFNYFKYPNFNKPHIVLMPDDVIPPSSDKKVGSIRGSRSGGLNGYGPFTVISRPSNPSGYVGRQVLNWFDEAMLVSLPLTISSAISSSGGIISTTIVTTNVFMPSATMIAGVYSGISKQYYISGSGTPACYTYGPYDMGCNVGGYDGGQFSLFKLCPEYMQASERYALVDIVSQTRVKVVEPKGISSYDSYGPVVTVGTLNETYPQDTQTAVTSGYRPVIAIK